MNESQLTTQIKNYLHSKCAYCEKIFGGGFQASGIADILCCYKGLFIAIEVKSPTGKGRASDIQKLKIKAIRQAGGVALITDNLEDVQKLFNFIDDCDDVLLGELKINSLFKYNDKYLDK